MKIHTQAKFWVGPVVEEGFYYDIWMPRPFTLDDMAAIEERMKKLIDQDYDVIKKMTPRDEVIAEFTARGEDYKLRLIADMPTGLNKEAKEALRKFDELTGNSLNKEGGAQTGKEKKKGFMDKIKESFDEH
jgi:threonyl-tRNA synthetase